MKTTITFHTKLLKYKDTVYITDLYGGSNLCLVSGSGAHAVQVWLKTITETESADIWFFPQ